MDRRQFGLAGLSVALGACNPVGRYLASSKTAEAKNMVGQIARALAAYMEKERELPGGGMARPKQLPPSAPRVPKDVPKGIKYMSEPKEWEQGTWKDIHFNITQPTYYSYEIETTADGQSAVVRAIGDLDGDGVLATFSRKVTLSGKEAKVDASITVENEFE